MAHAVTGGVVLGQLAHFFAAHMGQPGTNHGGLVDVSLRQTFEQRFQIVLLRLLDIDKIEIGFGFGLDVLRKIVDKVSFQESDCR